MERKLVALFGGPRVVSNGLVLDRFATQRAALMLARLAVSPGKRMTRDALAEALWPDDYLDASRVRVRKELARLREALGDAGDVVAGDRQFVWLDESLVDVDVDLVRSLLRSALLATTPAERAERLVRARNLCQAEPLAGFSDDWAEALRAELGGLRAKVDLELAKALVTAQRAYEAIEPARAAVAQDALSVEASKTLAQALMALEQADDARAEVDRLRTELRSAGRDSDMDIEIPMPNVAPKAHHLVGREFELGYVTDLLNPHRDVPCRLVTLAGPAGSGKTRLAEEATRVLAPLFAGGAFFLRLEDETESSAVQIPEGAGTLVVLDNGEQLLPNLAERVRDTLKANERRWILVTSIVPLGLVDETVVRLFPLPVPRGDGDAMAFPSVRLFYDVARRSGQHLETDRDTLQAVAKVAHALEGWPLAIVLAAGRVGVVPPQEMAERLEELPELLKSRRLDMPERHRAMDAAVAWSLRLLPLHAKSALVELARFDGPISRDRAREVLGDDALDRLEQLMEWGAIERIGTTFRLPSLVRRHALAWDVSETVAP